ncbi:MAG: glycosyltransferase [Candidatus Omnitrophica bacterium]|nr:glycosyltransferase [Candidatus Omnitrophota bacterium]
MKKIIIFNASSFVYGAERGLLNLLKVLNRGFDIIVVLPNNGPIEEKIKNISDHINIKIFPLPILINTLSFFYWIKFLILLMVNLAYFSWYVIKNKIDLVYTNSSLLLSPSIIAKITRKIHFWHVREFFISKVLNFWIGTFIRIFSDTVICQSNTIRERLFLMEKGTVIYEPLDLNDYKIYNAKSIKKEFNIPDESIVITIISRIHPLKGQYEFIEGIKDIIKENKKLIILIVGDITPLTLKNRLYKNKIDQLIKANGLKNVKLLGFRDDISKLLSMTDICVFPFLREEPFGIAVTEALAFGKISFYTMEGGLKEVYEMYKEGKKYDIIKIIEEINSYRIKPVNELEKGIVIPKILSFSEYKKNISLIFQK